MSNLAWSDSECPGCGATVVVGIMSLCATCRTCGMFYVDCGASLTGWYYTRDHYLSGGQPIGRS